MNYSAHKYWRNEIYLPRLGQHPVLCVEQNFHQFITEDIYQNVRYFYFCSLKLPCQPYPCVIYIAHDMHVLLMTNRFPFNFVGVSLSLQWISSKKIFTINKDMIRILNFVLSIFFLSFKIKTLIWTKYPNWKNWSHTNITRQYGLFWKRLRSFHNHCYDFV